MAPKRYKPEAIIAKLRQADILISQGKNLAKRGAEGSSQTT